MPPRKRALAGPGDFLTGAELEAAVAGTDAEGALNSRVGPTGAPPSQPRGAILWSPAGGVIAHVGVPCRPEDPVGSIPPARRYGCRGGGHSGRCAATEAWPTTQSGAGKQ